MVVEGFEAWGGEDGDAESGVDELGGEEVDELLEQERVVGDE